MTRTRLLQKRNFSKKQRLEQERSQMLLEMQSFRPTWEELNDFILPRRGRFFVSDRNRGDRRTENIIDNTATLAVRVIKAGMVTGITPKSRPWFNLSIKDLKKQSQAVRQWLEDVTEAMRLVFLRSNLYNVLPTLYGDMATFGTGAIYMEEDDEDVVHFKSLPIGSFAVGVNKKGVVNAITRDFAMTVREMVDKWGRREDGTVDVSNFSTHVQSLYGNSELDQWVDITHIITENDQFNPDKIDSKYKRFLSVYYERGTSDTNSTHASLIASSEGQKIISEKGYDFFPVLVGRWELTGEDIYGTSCPGLDTLGDIKQLQLAEELSLLAIEKTVNPPLVGPATLEKRNVGTLPGDVTYDDSSASGRNLRSIYDVNFNIQALEAKQEQTRDRIKKGFFVDLFLMLANSDRRQITATEIAERKEEKLLALGPVLEQLDTDINNPLIDNTFDIMQKMGLLPPAPEELQGLKLDIEYTSIMAQAQKLVGLSSLERFTAFIGNLAGINPEVLDTVDWDKMVEEAGDTLSLPEGILKELEDIQALRQARQQAQQQQAENEQIAMAAKSTKDLAQSPVGAEGASALDQLVQGG